MDQYHMRPPGRNAELAHRLRKLIARLASPHDGEIVAAVYAIRRTLKSASLDLHDLAAALMLDVPIIDTFPDRWIAVAHWCRDHDNGQLTTREREFVGNMIAWCCWREPTERQAAWLAAIADRLRNAGVGDASA